ncbi:MAG: MarR family transcriptional regulator [Gemmatimonadota bacterium]|nr:MarR family transcriptional regulator [Gemmatimonadota bacterium]
MTTQYIKAACNVTIDRQARDLMRYYPRIYFACHVRHRRDPETGDRLSAHQGSILDHLDEQDGTSVGALAKHMGVTAGTMSIHVDRLQRKGYITRSGDPRDGRRVLVRLTAAGVRVKEANSVLDAERVERLLRGLDARDRKRAIEGLRILALGADEMSAAQAAQRSTQAG